MFHKATINTITGGTFVVQGQRGGLKLLHQCVALGAFHDAAERGDPPRCHPRTREAILKKIMAWVEQRPENLQLFLLWMYGPAGAGKTAIAQTVAELCAKLNLLAASFFFSRTAAGRNDIERFISTLTWQLIKSIPEIREHIITSLEHDPSILARAPATQMKALIIDPLNLVSKEVLSRRPRLIIIDGLDECLDRKSQENIIKLLEQCVRQLTTPFQFLIASRPELEIRDTFSSDILRPITHTLPLEHDYQSDQDILHFLTSKFQELQSRRPHLPQSWPAKSDIDHLVQKSSGQFIYAAAVIRYIESRRHQPEDRLKTVLELRSSEKETPFASLDALYLQIFSSVKDDQLDDVMMILGALILTKRYEFNALLHLEDFFGYRTGRLEAVMCDMVALVDIPTKGIAYPIKFYHASLPDFLLDPSRSRKFFLDPPQAYTKLALQSLLCNHRRLDYHIVPQAIEYICHSVPTSKLVDTLLDFNPWPRQGDFKFYDILNVLPAFLQWLEEQVSCGPQSVELHRIQFRFFDNWVLEALRETPPDCQAFLPAAICIHSSGVIDLARCIEDIFLPLGEQNPLTFLYIGYGPYSTKTASRYRYLSELLNDASRAKEFLLTETHFTNFAVRCAKLTFGLMRCTRASELGHKDFRTGTAECLRLSLPRSSNSPELVKLLRDHAFRPIIPSDSGSNELEEKRKETAKECLEYIKRYDASDSRKRHRDGDDHGLPKLKKRRGRR